MTIIIIIYNVRQSNVNLSPLAQPAQSFLGVGRCFLVTLRWVVSWLFCQVERRFHIRESNRQPLRSVIGYLSTSSGSLGLSPAQLSNVMHGNIFQFFSICLRHVLLDSSSVMGDFRVKSWTSTNYLWNSIGSFVTSRGSPRSLARYRLHLLLFVICSVFLISCSL
jgi:hypothetical protein